MSADMRPKIWASTSLLHCMSASSAFARAECFMPAEAFLSSKLLSLMVNLSMLSSNAWTSLEDFRLQVCARSCLRCARIWLSGESRCGPSHEVPQAHGHSPRDRLTAWGGSTTTACAAHIDPAACQGAGVATKQKGLLLTSDWPSGAWPVHARRHSSSHWCVTKLDSGVATYDAGSSACGSANMSSAWRNAAACAEGCSGATCTAADVLASGKVTRGTACVDTEHSDITTPLMLAADAPVTPSMRYSPFKSVASSGACCKHSKLPSISGGGLGAADEKPLSVSGGGLGVADEPSEHLVDESVSIESDRRQMGRILSQSSFCSCKKKTRTSPCWSKVEPHTGLSNQVGLRKCSPSASYSPTSLLCESALRTLGSWKWRSAATSKPPKFRRKSWLVSMLPHALAPCKSPSLGSKPFRTLFKSASPPMTAKVSFSQAWHRSLRRSRTMTMSPAAVHLSKNSLTATSLCSARSWDSTKSRSRAVVWSTPPRGGRASATRYCSPSLRLGSTTILPAGSAPDRATFSETANMSWGKRRLVNRKSSVSLASTL
mmetsp:Transcript_101907/g.287571  ORF Transcript_101907/g.287571 Transcript_101907/m.287571 type:complete len:546 (+) Transcript_101907:1220-2857(+)